MTTVLRPGLSLIVTCAVIVTSATPSLAEDSGNLLAGPVLGMRLGGPEGDRWILGVEGGAGVGPERLNVGFTHRLGHMFYYAELDPWYLLGGSLGMGVDSFGKFHPVVGVWEGVPLTGNIDCNDDWDTLVTLAGGYRWTGVHELYLTVKAGRSKDTFCFD